MKSVLINHMFKIQRIYLFSFVGLSSLPVCMWKHVDSHPEFYFVFMKVKKKKTQTFN